MQPNRSFLFLQRILQTRPEEIACTECGPRVPEYAEAVLAHQDGDGRFYLVESHLFQCTPCREEYEALKETIAREQEWSTASAQQIIQDITADA